MTVKYLSELLAKLDQKMIITMASDEEGNNFADVDSQLDKRVLLDGRSVYTIFPIGSEDQYQA